MEGHPLKGEGCRAGFCLASCFSWRPVAAKGIRWPIRSGGLVAPGDADAPAEVEGGDPTAEFTTAADMTGWTGCHS